MRWCAWGWRHRVGRVRAARVGLTVDAAVRPRSRAVRKLEERRELLALVGERALVPLLERFVAYVLVSVLLLVAVGRRHNDFWLRFDLLLRTKRHF